MSTERKNYPDVELDDILESHAKTNAALLLRIAELETESKHQAIALGAIDSIMGTMKGVSITPVMLAAANRVVELEHEAVALREQVATLTQQRDHERAARRAESDAFNRALDAAKADAARLRAELQDCESWIVDATRTDADSEGAATEQLASMRAALAADDSAAWLESKIAERTAPLEKEIERWAEIAAEKFSSGLDIIREREKSLQQQLVAATNDAARAELRARDLSEQIRKIDSAASTCLSAGWSGGARRRHLDPALNEAIQTIAASPDSDERLREVMSAAVIKALDWQAGVHGKDAADAAKLAIDEVLRGGV